MPTPAQGPAVMVIQGPTATGKTGIAVEVARRVGGEIISADSRAFFVGLDIVTAKPAEDERRGVQHHLLDRVSICGAYDAMSFRQDVERLVPAIVARGRVPIVAGGGTLYLGAILHGIFDGPAKDPQLRGRMNAEPCATLHRRLRTVDPVAAVAIHPNDRLRMVRALEVFTLTQRPISQWQAEAEPLPYDFLSFTLQRDRVEHRTAIVARTERMLADGLVKEVARLREDGLSPECQAYRTIGIPETIRYLEGELTLEGLAEEMIRQTWALARRQASWFRRERRAILVDVSGASAEQAAEGIVERWRGRPS